MMGEAHAQDFERKRRPGAAVPASPYQHGRAGPESSDEEEEDEQEEDEQEAAAGGGGGGEDEEEDNTRDVQDAEDILRRHRSGTTDA